MAEKKAPKKKAKSKTVKKASKKPEAGAVPQSLVEASKPTAPARAFGFA